MIMIIMRMMIIIICAAHLNHGWLQQLVHEGFVVRHGDYRTLYMIRVQSNQQ